jgi:aspartyl-tRNA(Asn)/glutamyl-tRNA(Gln) amidotransferase subunit C
MSDLNEDLIKKLSSLSRIELKEDEVPSFCATIKQIIEYFGQLNEVDLSDLSPYSHVEAQGVGSLREDESGPGLKRELFLANAPDQIGGMIRVPPILKENR